MSDLPLWVIGALLAAGFVAGWLLLWFLFRLLPTRRLALVMALASVAAWFLPGDGWLGLWVMNGAAQVVAAVDGLLGPRPRRFTVTRELPLGVTLGGEGTLTWTIRNPARRSVRMGLADDLAPSLRASTRRVIVRIPGRGTARATATLHPARRGRFQLRSVTLRVDGPLGLGARQEVAALRGELRVYPSFRSKDDAELRIRRARLLEVGLRSARGRGGGTEFEQLREYGVDDEFRRIDWAATARAAKPIVRTYRAERNQTVVLLLDNGRVMAGRVDGVPRVEHAMDAVMAMTTVASGLGDRCGLVAFDREVQAVVQPRHGKGQLGRMVEALHPLEPALVESDYAGAFSETLARFRRRTLLVVLTDLVEQAVNEWLVPALPLITREHLVVVAGVSDPDVIRWSRPRLAGSGVAREGAAEALPDGVTSGTGGVVGAASQRDHDLNDLADDDPLTAYRRTAAVAALAERQRVVARLRALGATVVDAKPGRLASDLADAYLEIKATGRL